MRASPAVLASAYSFVNQGASRTAAPATLLRGRWVCKISETPESGVPRSVATGIVDILHAGSYLVGSGWLDGPDRTIPDGTIPDGGVAQLPSAGLEGPMFGAMRGDEVVLWVTNVFRTAMWVLRGTLSARGRVITGTAVHTDTARGSNWCYEASFVLTGT